MASYFRQNYQLFCKRNPAAKVNQEYYLKWAQYDREKNAVYKKDGILYLKKEEKSYQLCSQNPKEEAKLLTRQMESNKEQIFVVFGMANIELLRRLLVNSNPQSKIAVMEPDQDVFSYCMEHYNLREFITSEKVMFFTGHEALVTQLIHAYFGGNWINLVNNIVTISLPNYHIYREYEIEQIKKIREKMEYTMQCMGNSLGDMLFGLRNHYKNIDACIEANSYEEVFGKYHGIPAIVVASGPSLDKNIQYLKQAQGKALIISCDASYVTCIQNGVVPDAIASIERGETTYEYFYKGQKFHEGLVLVGPSLLWPKTHEEFPGKQLLFAKNHSGTEGWWSENFENMIFVDMGHSCATAAYGFARAAGCDPVILIGQDLAYTDDKKHSTSVHDTVFTAEGDNKLQIEEKAALDEEETIWTTDIYGKPIRTSAVFNLFRKYFENHIAAHINHTLIDATEGGAKIEGSVIMTLQEAINQYCTKEIGHTLNDLLEDKVVTKEYRLEHYNRIYSAADKAFKQLQHVKKMAVEHYEFLQQYTDFDFENASTEELIKVVEAMQEGNKILEYLDTEAKDIRSYYQTVLKETVIKVKTIGNGLDGENVKKNWKIQNNLMSLLEIASVATAEVMLEMMTFVEEKKNRLLEES